MSYDQIVVIFRRCPIRDVTMQKANLIGAIRLFTLNSLARQLEHPFARVNAVNLHAWISPEQFAKEPPIPLAHYEGTARRLNFSETGHAGLLQRVPKRDLFQRQIPAPNGIETHKAIMSRRTIGVSRTRSASAVRASLPRLFAPAWSKARRTALAPTHPKMGDAAG